MSGRHLLVAGAINTDLVASMERAPKGGETITGSGFAIHGGGKGANQAVAAARSGTAVSILGAVGDDDFGRHRLEELEDEGICCDHVTTVSNAASGVALIFVESAGENRIAYVPGSTSQITSSDCERGFAAIAPSHLLVPHEVPSLALLHLLQLARSASVHVTLNAAPDPELVLPLLPFVDVLVVNRAEADDVLRITGVIGHDTDDRLLALQRLGPKSVIMTAGERGADARFGRDVFHQAAPQVDVIDTTGAGDAFCGAFVSALMRGQDPRLALEYGVVASALSVTLAGAQTSIPFRTEIESLVAEQP